MSTVTYSEAMLMTVPSMTSPSLISPDCSVALNISSKFSAAFSFFDVISSSPMYWEKSSIQDWFLGAFFFSCVAV